MTGSNIVPFSFENHPIRVSDEDGEPWFVLVDVCAVLEISKHRDAASRLDEDERGSVVVDTPGGPQPTIVINESGLWSLVLTSRKPAAKRLKKWVTSEVIPSIRKTGTYSVANVGPTARVHVAREHRLTMGYNLRIAKMLGLEGNQAVLSANRATLAVTGIDTLGLMGITHIKAPQNDVLLSPSEIGSRLGGLSGQRINQVLCDMGLQERFPKLKGGYHYQPTEEGKAAGGVMQDAGKSHGDGTPVRHLKWACPIVHMVEEWMESRAA
jgi:prophage antirepressor-like protein